MLYDILAVLWDSPGTDEDVFQGLEERTHLADHAAITGYLSFLQHFGFVERRDLTGRPIYTLNEAGSALLARLAHDFSTPSLQENSICSITSSAAKRAAGTSAAASAPASTAATDADAEWAQAPVAAAI